MSYPGDGKVKLPLNRISGTDFPGKIRYQTIPGKTV